MKCLKCGMELRENDVFCPNCGQQVKKESTNNVITNNNMFEYERTTNNQQNFQSGVNQQNYRKEPIQKKKDNTTIQICIVAIVATIIVAAIILIVYFTVISKNQKNSSSKNSNTTNNSISNTINNNTNSDSIDGKVTTVSNKKDSSYKVNYQGFKFYIPDNLIYEVDYDNDEIIFGDSELTWKSEFAIAANSSMQKIKQNQSELNTLLMQTYEGLGIEGITISSATEETIGGVDYILLEASQNGTNMLMAYAELNSMNTAFFITYNENNDYDRSILNNISNIIKNAEYEGEASYLKTNTNTKMKNVINKFNENMASKK